ncbi:hypothetical protein SNE40_023606 [Patella caerulea]|uniref:Apple domain-containing protein n=1 Tax=Patella caerulea TaxID=87958 RepID=A0AAN8FW52_PATCE
MVNLVAVLILVLSMVQIVSLNYVKLYTDKVVTFAATNTSRAKSSMECALACQLNHPCVSYAFNPVRVQCLLYDRVLHRADPTSVDGGSETFTSEFGDDNIALHKPTEQSSTWKPYTSPLGVDGDKTTRFHTRPNAWWCVDLLTVRAMKWLVIYNILGRK